MLNSEAIKFIDLPEIVDKRGSLTYLQSQDHVPFEIKRVYFLHDVPPNEVRGAHAHKNLQQVIFAIRGSFFVSADDGNVKIEINLNKPNKGLYIKNLVWRELYQFSADAVCMVVASENYYEDDYLRDYDEFMKSIWDKNHGSIS